MTRTQPVTDRSGSSHLTAYWRWDEFHLVCKRLRNYFWIFNQMFSEKLDGSGLCLSADVNDRLQLAACDASNKRMVWKLEKRSRYPQFFSISQRLSGRCLVLINSEPQLDDCYDFTVNSRGHWNGNWWRFDEYITVWFSCQKLFEVHYDLDLDDVESIV